MSGKLGRPTFTPLCRSSTANWTAVLRDSSARRLSSLLSSPTSTATRSTSLISSAYSLSPPECGIPRLPRSAAFSASLSSSAAFTPRK